MSAFTRFVGGLLMAVGMTGCGAFDGWLDHGEPELVIKDGAAQRDFRFTYVANLPKAPAGAKRLDLWLPLPSSGVMPTSMRTLPSAQDLRTGLAGFGSGFCSGW